MFTKFDNKFINKFTNMHAILVSVCLSSDTEKTVLSRVLFAYKSKPKVHDKRYNNKQYRYYKNVFFLRNSYFSTPHKLKTCRPANLKNQGVIKLIKVREENTNCCKLYYLFTRFFLQTKYTKSMTVIYYIFTYIIYIYIYIYYIYIYLCYYIYIIYL